MIDTITYEHPEKNPKTISSRRGGVFVLGIHKKNSLGKCLDKAINKWDQSFSFSNKNLSFTQQKIGNFF
jgi:hypothetical protein